LFRRCAEEENRSLPNFIETAALLHIRETEFVDEFEMGELRRNRTLGLSIRRGHRDAKRRKGRFVQ
jgi:aminoglycoside/choline kinase family phosphotransferase